jgi:hypothetical protein
MSQSLRLAQEVAWNLATTLMVCVTLFKADIGFGALPATEFDRDPDSIIYEFDPWVDSDRLFPANRGSGLSQGRSRGHRMKIRKLDAKTFEACQERLSSAN